MSFSEAIHIQEFMEVFGSCGNRVGHVDRIEKCSIVLLKSDFADHRTHTIPLAWVDRVGKNVLLNKSYKDIKREWAGKEIQGEWAMAPAETAL